MNHAINSIKCILSETISKYISTVSSSLNIPEEILQKIWDEVDDVPEHESEEPAQITPTCVYVYKHKSKVGVVCNAKIRGEGNLCGKHKPKTTDSQTPKGQVLRKRKDLGVFVHTEL